MTMAKKKRKHYIKLNNKIRDIFNGKPFDEGIESVDDDLLTSLILLTGIQLSSMDRESMIRNLRRIWSEGEYRIRKEIVDFLLSSRGSDLKNRQNRQKEKSTIDIVSDMISDLNCSRDEEEELLQYFLDSGSGKINKSKLQNRLQYIRMREKRDRIMRIATASLNLDDRLEFTDEFIFRLSKHIFIKYLTVKSEPLDIDKLASMSDEELSEYIKIIKEKAVREKELQIDEFAAKLERHRYLNQDTIEEAIRKMNPDTDLIHIPLPAEVVERVILSTLPEDYKLFVMESDEHFLIQRESTIELYGSEIKYIVKLSYGKKFIYASVWDSRDLPVLEDLSSVEEDMKRHFSVSLDTLYKRMLEQADGLDIESDDIQKHIITFLEPQLNASGNLKIKEKTKRRILYHFSEYLKPLKEKKMREELLAKTIKDFKLLYPIARKLKRKITFHVGPTNSGKTWSAMQRLKKADSGYYLAPLRLLALEGYESMLNDGIKASLITGEEEIIDEESTHISSTIEMLNSDVEVDVCVIDEIQMISDRDRGWAWTNALIGAPAKEVILTGSENALSAVEEICRYLGEELKVIHFERKNPLTLMDKPVALKKIKAGSAVVAFSRKEVLSLKQQLSEKFSVSVVYGNLSPEVRREEARRFREGESEILVATDAIAMGLNLPIKTLLFSRDNKFDGVKRRELNISEVLQIAGRAGRYGIHEEGFVGAVDKATLNTIKEKIYQTPPDVTAPFTVMASLEHVLLISEILESEKLTEILGFFSENMEFDGPFTASNIDSMLEVATIVDEYDIDLKARYHLSCAPVSLGSPYIESIFHRYLRDLEKGEIVKYIPPRKLPQYAVTNEEMLNAEDRVKEVSLYLWLSFKFPESFPDTESAKESRYILNGFIERSLQKGDFGKKCRVCGKRMDYTFRYNICDKCFKCKRVPNSEKSSIKWNKNRRYRGK